VDCVRKGPPSLEFPVRKGARSSLKTKTRGSAHERGEGDEENREGESGTLREGGAVEPGGGKARGR